MDDFITLLRNKVKSLARSHRDEFREGVENGPEFIALKATLEHMVPNLGPVDLILDYENVDDEGNAGFNDGCIVSFESGFHLYIPL